MVSDCDMWIAKINAEAGIRVDETGWKARQDVDEIYKMCKDREDGRGAEDRYGHDDDARYPAIGQGYTLG